MHLLITDSGLGGLSVCAGAERTLGRAASGVRITYFNAWPEDERGYNDMPDLASRVGTFDRALAAMAALHPDVIVIACNTLSVVYRHTAFRRAATLPVLGILDAGVGLFAETLRAEPETGIILLGTKTTIESDVHRQGLLAEGVQPERVRAVACHGLARAIETDPDGQAVADHIDRCAGLAADNQPAGTRLSLGVCCTHYTYVRERIRSALGHACGREVAVLDPNDRLVSDTAAVVRLDTSTPVPPVGGHETGSVTVVSKVEMDDRKRRAIARRIERTSPPTAAALLAYTRVPDLF